MTARPSVEVGTLREALRKIRELRACLVEMLDEAEAAALTGLWPHPPGGEPRLCKTLADSMRTEGGGAYRQDLRLIKRARRALGLPAWWDQP